LLGHAGELDLTVEEHCQFATDRETKAGPAVFSRRPCICLLEGLEDQLLFLRRNPDARILHGESNHVLGLTEHGMIDAPASRRQLDTQADMASSRKLDGVRHEILQDLLQTLLVVWLVTLVMEVSLPSRSAEDRIARRSLLRGPLSGRFLGFAIILGVFCPLGILTFFGHLAMLVSIAAILALAGLFWFEYLWVRAGQSAPLS